MTPVKKFLLPILACSIFLGQTKNIYAESLKVGAILPLSGEPATVGENCRKGVELARREQDKAGVAISVYYEDTPGASARNTLSAFHKLRSTEKVENFLGFLWAEELGAVGPIADKQNLALIGFSLPSYRPKNSILIWPSENQEAKLLAQEVRKKYSQVAILSENNTWATNFSTAFTKEFSKLGGKIAETIEHSADNKDVSSSVMKLKKYSLQALIVPPYILFPEYAKALHKLGMNLPIYGAELDQSAVDRAQGAAEGAIIVGPADPSSQFIQNFKREFAGTNPDIPAGNCYDALNMYVDAFKARQSGKGRDIIEYLKSLKSYPGALGTYRFEAGETVMDLGYKRIENGTLVPFNPS